MVALWIEICCSVLKVDARRGMLFEMSMGLTSISQQTEMIVADISAAIRNA